jgi:uncharacterized protein (TIGR02217 family)
MAAPQLLPTLTGIEWPVKRTPVWSTLKQQSISGIDTRFALWSYPRYRYEISYSMLRSDVAHIEWQTLVGFYNQCSGAAGAFYYLDPIDNQAFNQGFGVGDGVTRSFQLVRALGGFVDPLFAVESASIMIGGVVTGAYTLFNGLVNFNVAPGVGAPLTWSGTFVWLCRFDDDAVDFDQFAYNYWELKKLVFTTVKL